MLKTTLHSPVLVLAVAATFVSLIEGNTQATLGWLACSFYVALAVFDA